ncbi:hypothetical protein PtrEW13061_011680, partial [Pyrenophora tritici-repentis]
METAETGGAILEHPEVETESSYKLDQGLTVTSRFFTTPGGYPKLVAARILVGHVAPSKGQPRQIADKLLLKARYNFGSEKTHIIKYNHDFLTKDIVKAIYHFQKQRAQQYLSRNKVQIVRDYLRHSERLCHHSGTLPDTPEVIEKEEPWVELQEEDLFHKKHKNSSPSPKAQKPRLKEVKLSAIATYKPPTVHDLIAEKQKLQEQNEDTIVHLLIENSPGLKTVSRIASLPTTKNATQPNMQSSHTAHINITERNLRPMPLSDEATDYEDQHKITDVSDA